MTVDDITFWARGRGLEIVLIVIGAILLVRAIRAVADVLVRRTEARQAMADQAGVPSEQAKHQRALIQVGSWSALVLVSFIAGILVLERCNVPLTSLVAPATVAGVAVGFGAQRIVQDLLSGFFIITERQYGFGDIIRVAQPGQPSGVAGVVEEVTLRATKLRTMQGELVVIPNGEIRQVTNLSRDWAQVVLDVPLPADADAERAIAVLDEVGARLREDAEWGPVLLEEPKVIGVEAMTVGLLQIRLVARTLPGKQWDVARALRLRIADAFRAEGLTIPTPFVVPPGVG